MSGSVQLRTEADAIVVRIPLKVRKSARQGRELMVATGDRPARPVARHEHATILKALGRAYRWKRMLESGEFNSISDLARAEKINHAYLRRILRLTLLSPEITEAILDKGLMSGRQLEQMLKTSSDAWAEQAGQLQ